MDSTQPAPIAGNTWRKLNDTETQTINALIAMVIARSGYPGLIFVTNADGNTEPMVLEKITPKQE